MCACIAGAWLTYLPGALQVPLSSPMAGAIVPAAAGCPHRTVGVQSLHPRGPIPSPSSWHLPGMCVVWSSVACRSCFQHFGSRVLKEMFGWNDRSRTLLVLVAYRWPAVVVSLDMEVSGVGGTSQGVIGTKISGASVFGSATSFLPCSSDSTSPLINWRWVESEAGLARL
jgi:hypothetical protein